MSVVHLLSLILLSIYIYLQTSYIQYSLAGYLSDILTLKVNTSHHASQLGVATIYGVAIVMSLDEMKRVY